jgi:hypothetical protein
MRSATSRPTREGVPPSHSPLFDPTASEREPSRVPQRVASIASASRHASHSESRASRARAVTRPTASREHREREPTRVPRPRNRGVPVEEIGVDRGEIGGAAKEGPSTARSVLQYVSTERRPRRRPRRRGRPERPRFQWWRRSMPGCVGSPGS